MGTEKENFIGVDVGIGIGIDKTTGKSTPIPIPIPTPMKRWGSVGERECVGVGVCGEREGFKGEG